MSEDTIRRLSTGELLRRLVNNLSAMFDREVDLAKEEAKEDAIRVGAGTATLGFGLLLLYTFVAALIVAAILAVYETVAPITPVTAALVTAGVFLVLGIVIAAVGFFLVRIRPMEATRESLREDIEWARRRAS